MKTSFQQFVKENIYPPKNEDEKWKNYFTDIVEYLEICLRFY
jgi:hypothetical protein